MNKQALHSLTLQQLQQCKHTLSKRIDDLKFFNLDLGRENIKLSQDYRQLRDKADRVKQGKMGKVRKARNYRKNIYLQQKQTAGQSQSATYGGQDQSASYNSQSINSSSGNFNFNDLYKLSKNKLSHWLEVNKIKKPSTSSSSKKHQTVNQPQVLYNHHNHQQFYYHQNQYQQGINYNQEPPVVYQEQIVYGGDFPEPQVMASREEGGGDPLEQEVTVIVRQSSGNVQQGMIRVQQLVQANEDPMEQPITRIVRQYPQTYEQTEQFGHYQSSPVNTTSHHHHPHSHHPIPQPNYQRLYQHQDQQNYITQEQKTHIHDQQQGNKISRDLWGRPIQQNRSIPQHEQRGGPNKKKGQSQKEKKTMKNFQFDDLPGIGWKKLKGLISWGSKGSASNQNNKDNHKDNSKKQNQGEQRKNSNTQSLVVEQAVIPQYGPSSQQAHQRHSSTQQSSSYQQPQPQSRKRTPIFSSSLSSNYRQDPNIQKSLKQERVEKELVVEQYQRLTKKGGQMMREDLSVEGNDVRIEEIHENKEKKEEKEKQEERLRQEGKEEVEQQREVKQEEMIVEKTVDQNEQNQAHDQVDDETKQQCENEENNHQPQIGLQSKISDTPIQQKEFQENQEVPTKTQEN